MLRAHARGATNDNVPDPTRIDAAALIIDALMVVPGVFLDLTSFIRFASAMLILGTVPAVVLMMRRDRRAGILAD